MRRTLSGGWVDCGSVASVHGGDACPVGTDFDHDDCIDARPCDGDVEVAVAVISVEPERRLAILEVPAARRLGALRIRAALRYRAIAHPSTGGVHPRIAEARRAGGQGEEECGAGEADAGGFHHGMPMRGVVAADVRHLVDARRAAAWLGSSGGGRGGGCERA